MTIQNYLQNSDTELENSQHPNLSEIGKILATAIFRLHNKKSPKIEQKQLDSNSLRSVHGVNNNLNRATL
jgi:UDP-galactopyranose mutase